MGLLLIYLFLALFTSFLCSILEAVLLSTPMSFITMKVNENARGAKRLKNYKQDTDKPISAILSLNTIAHTIGAAGVGSEAVRLWGDEIFGLVSTILTILILVFTEIIPKTLGTRYWRSFALSIVPIIRFMIILTYPLGLLSKGITKIFAGKQQSASVSKEEVSAMVDVGEEEGVFDKEESKMLQSMIKISAVKAEDVMTPSVVVECAHKDMTTKEFYAEKAFRTYSRIPIYSTDSDFIDGYVLKQTVLEKLADDFFDLRLEEIKRPILSFAEQISVADIFDEMIRKKEHISVIIDEYGCMRGIITLEDIIETMLGLEIVDEKDTIIDMRKFARDLWESKQASKQPVEIKNNNIPTKKEQE